MDNVTKDKLIPPENMDKLTALAVAIGKSCAMGEDRSFFLTDFIQIFHFQEASFWIKTDSGIPNRYKKLLVADKHSNKTIRADQVITTTVELSERFASEDFIFYTENKDTENRRLFTDNKAHTPIIFPFGADAFVAVLSKHKIDQKTADALPHIAKIFKQNKRHLIQSALLYSESSANLLKHITYTNEAVLTLEPNTLIIQGVSASVKSMFGYTPESLLNQQVNDVFLFYKADEVKKLVAETLKKGVIEEYYIEMVDSDYTIRYCTAESYLIQNIRRGDKSIRCIIRDRTDYYQLKKERDRLLNKTNVLSSKLKRYEDVVNNNPLAIIYCDANGIIKYANQAFQRMTQYHYSEVVGKKTSILRSGFHDHDFYGDLWQTVQSGVVWDGELYNKKKNGEYFWAALKISPLRNDQGKISAFIGVYLDISKVKKMEDLLTKARLQAEQENVSKGLFLATMSHEIRNPMNAIIGNVELLQKTPLNNTQQNFLRRIQVSSEGLLHMINDILDFSKIESGQLMIEKIAFNLKEMIFDLIDSLRTKAEKKNIHLEVNLDEAMVRFVRGDKYRLQQVLLNLLNNAIKFTEKGTVSLTCETIAKPNPTLLTILFSVKDTGIGIAKEKLHTIFDRFVQEDQSTTRQYGGTGLGLAISKQLVQLMGGELKVESTKNVGSNFYFALPFEKANDSEIVGIDISDKNIDKPNIFVGKRILIVDDLEFNIDIAHQLLLSWGSENRFASNGQIAVEILKEDPHFDLILMDLRMPVLDGLQATRIIRNQLKLDIPIIGLTGEVLKEKIEECFEAGMNDYISKPFKRQQLLKKIYKNMKR